MEKIAAIRLRGKWNIRDELERTLVLLGLKRKNNCVILENDKYTQGMLKKAKDYIAYGEIKEETLKKLIEKKKPMKQNEKKMIFNLPNPKKGFKSIKKGHIE